MSIKGLTTFAKRFVILLCSFHCLLQCLHKTMQIKFLVSHRIRYWKIYKGYGSFWYLISHPPLHTKLDIRTKRLVLPHQFSHGVVFAGIPSWLSLVPVHRLLADPEGSKKCRVQSNKCINIPLKRSVKAISPFSAKERAFNLLWVLYTSLPVPQS